MTGACGALGWCGIRDLYSAPSVNTGSDQSRTGRESPESAEIGRDTRLLYALYSVVFRGHLHTNSASQPYSRKGFQICIQCIQHIPTPPLFAFFLLLGPEYMNTANTPAGPNAVVMDQIRPYPHPLLRLRCRRSGGFVFSGPREYMRRPTLNEAPNARIGRKGPRHAPVVCIVFSCIQMPNAYKFRP